MRERTTWNRDQIVKLANSLKKADDPRAMNQDHLKQQPAADKYEIGGPSEFGEDVHPSTNTWKAEYSGGEVKRNEIGMPELRGDTFNHAEKTAAQDDDKDEDDDFLEKKADVCLSIAKRMLPKTASEQMIEDQAFAFMHLADADIIATHARLAAQDEDDDKKQSQQQQDKAQQDKEAGQIPENFKKKDDEGDKAQQDKEAGQIPENFKKDEDKKDDDKGQQSKEAQGQQQDDKKQSQGQQDQDDDKKQASDRIAALRKQACDALMSGDQQGAQQAVQQIAQLQQQSQQQQQLSQQQAQQQVDQMLAQQLQQQPQQSDDQMLDQMLQQQVQASTDTSMLTAGTGPMMDIQLEGPSMDMTEVRLGSEDEALTALFASHDEVQQAAQAQSLQTGIPVQASTFSMSRTASTRTVGTRPTGGVSQLGGASAPSSGGEIDKLAGLWASAPNVKSVFDT
jgi:hypothetical protein